MSAGNSGDSKAKKTTVEWVEPPRLGVLGKSYLILFIKGITTALKHLFFHKKITLQSPEERHKIVDPTGYRGVHRLNKDEQGRVKCVACFLCATACPAHCIDIVAEPSPWPDREKYPKVFNIDELRCIFCGMCEQACPVEAIELTSFYDLTGASREEMIFDKEKLLSVFDKTKDLEPMPSKRPPAASTQGSYNPIQAEGSAAARTGGAPAIFGQAAAATQHAPQPPAAAAPSQGSFRAEPPAAHGQGGAP